jgi:hypothetical protein
MYSIILPYKSTKIQQTIKIISQTLAYAHKVIKILIKYA